MKMDAKAIEAFKKLGKTDEEIAVLVEKAERSTVDPNIVEKSDDVEAETETEDVVVEDKTETETGEEIGMLQGLLARILGKEESPPAATEKVTEVDEQSIPTLEITDEVVKSISDKVKSDIQENLVGAINEALEPLGPVMKAVVERLQTLEAEVVKMRLPIEEQMADKLSELPPVVKVSMRNVKSTETVSPAVTIPSGAPKTPNQALFANIRKSVSDLLGNMEAKYVA